MHVSVNKLLANRNKKQSYHSDKDQRKYKSQSLSHKPDGQITTNPQHRYWPHHSKLSKVPVYTLTALLRPVSTTLDTLLVLGS